MKMLAFLQFEKIPNVPGLAFLVNVLRFLKTHNRGTNNVNESIKTFAVGKICGTHLVATPTAYRYRESDRPRGRECCTSDTILSVVHKVLHRVNIATVLLDQKRETRHAPSSLRRPFAEFLGIVGVDDREDGNA